MTLKKKNIRLIQGGHGGMIKHSNLDDQNETIDYMHPDGKPATFPRETPNIEESIKEKHKMEKQMEETDGHHMCHSQCQKHHSVKAK